MSLLILIGINKWVQNPISGSHACRRQHLAEKSKSRQYPRYEHQSLITREEIKTGIYSGARMFNYSKEGLYFEANYILEPGDEIFIGIENSPYTSASGVYECYRAVVKWSKKMTDTATLPPRETYQKIVENINKVMRGQSPAIRKLLAAFASEGHVLLEDYPGTGKTTLLRSISIIFETIGRRVVLAAPTGRAARRRGR